MKLWKRLCAAALAAAVAAGFSISSASACTSLFVGGALTANGSTFFGRGEDIGEEWAKIFQVIEAADHEEGEMYEDSSGFTMPYPAHTYRYTYVRDSLEYGENIVDDDGNVLIPAYAQAGINELGVSVTATVSTIYNEALDGFDAPTDEGICEISIAGVVLQEAVSARHGVELLAAILDEYGAGHDYGYYNSILIGDADEVWNFLIVSAHNYAAVKLPADKVSINPNIVTMGEIDVTDEDVFASPGLISMPLEAGLLVSSQYDPDTYQEGDELTKINIRETYGTDDGMGQYTRFWQGVNYLNGAMAAQLDLSDYSRGTMLHSAEEDGPISFLFDADRKLSTLDVMQFFAERGEGTDYDSNEDDSVWSIGNEHQAEVHLFEVRHDEALPAELATIEWLAMNRAEYSVFLPFYSALLTETADIYHCDWTNGDGEDWAYYAEDLEIFEDMVGDPSGLPENSMFWTFAAINDLCDNDREHYGAKVKEFWESYQNALIEQRAGVDKAMLHIYNADPALAEETATALGKAVAQEAFDYAKQILDELWDFVQAYEAGEVDGDAVFTPSVMGSLPSYSILMAMDDVSSKYWSWYGGHVEYVLENGLMLGESASSFGLNGPVSGKYAADVLSGLADSDAFTEGLELGDGPVSREDIVVMLWRLTGSKAVDMDLGSYADTADLSDYAVDAMKWAVDAGLVSGYIDETASPFSGILRPAQAATRVELAKLLNVFCEDVLK